MKVSGSRNSKENLGSSKSPSLNSPAAARMIPSYSFWYSFSSLVSTFPRSRRHSTSPRSMICTWRLGLPVPIILGLRSGVRPFTVTKTSLGSSRFKTAPIQSPSLRSIGMSFALWTARSISPFKMDCSNSSTKAPFPPKATREVFKILSPFVIRGTNSHFTSGHAASIASATMFVCTSASLLFRVPIRTVRRFIASILYWSSLSFAIIRE